MLLGDLNVYFEDERILSLLRPAGFLSAHALVHWRDVPICPTPLEAPTIDPTSSVEQTCDFVLLRQPDSSGPHASLRLDATSACLAGNMPLDTDPTLYPSDHYAVLATIEVSAT